MSNVLSFYLDGTVVQAVRANISKDSVSIKDVRTFPHDELENYLSGCREKACILCCNPSAFHQDIVYLPPAAGKFYDSLVRAEVQKQHSDLTSFTLFYRTIGEATIDGAPHNKIAAFSYADDSLSGFMSIFSQSGKVITNLYAAPYPIFRLAVSACTADSNHARIFVAALPGEKLILLSEKEEFEFIRTIPSQETALLPADIQNVNMTIDYCFQSLRVRSTEAIILNPAPKSEEHAPSLTIPFKSVYPLSLAGVPDQVAQEYLAPLAAALHHCKSPGECDILPSDYVSFKQNKRILAIGTMILIMFVLLLGGLVMRERMIVSDITSRISALRAHLSSAGAEIAIYRKLDEETKTLDNPIAFLNKLNTSQNPETALAALTFPRTTDYSFKGVTLKKGEGFVSVHLEGTITASGYKETQTIYEGVIKRIGKIPGYSISSSSVDIKLKTITIEARYSGAGQQGK
jgi:hypothetical protein